MAAADPHVARASLGELDLRTRRRRLLVHHHRTGANPASSRDDTCRGRAECQHEKNAIDAAAAVADASTLPLLRAGADEFLDALAALWDVLDAALLGSGIVRETRQAVAG